MATIESEVDEVDGGDGGRDQIAYAESRAHALSGHGLGVIRVVVEAHNGEIQQGIGSNGEWRVIVRLPISPT
jgi:very-short-patch-repair endonuclease